MREKTDGMMSRNVVQSLVAVCTFEMAMIQFTMYTYEHR